VGQLIQQKGFDVLLKALKDVNLSREIELQAVYQTGQLERCYMDMASDFGIREKVHFLGFKNPFELADLYHDADLFILPTFAEALPSVITEAMMCGTPLIATAVGGIPEQIGQYGMLVQPGDVDGLVDAIYRALDQKADLIARGKERSDYAMRKFSCEAMIKKHIDLYEELLLTGRGSKRNNGAKRFLNPIIRHLI
jgi:glycosyltransferase involved in cell wall biosynthesis